MSKIVHFEIPMDDEKRAGAFYRDVLGWEVSQFGDMPYWLVKAGEEDEFGADGALTPRDDLHRAPVVVAAVDDAQAALDRAVAAGGRVVQGSLPIPGMGWAGYFADTEGNVVGVFQVDESAAFPGEE